jgi:hypothetical protein
MQKRNIVWLASYPKSGNTWFRAFLSALKTGDAGVDINNLKDSAFFAKRDTFEEFTDLDSRYLYHGEVKQLLPDVYRAFSNESETIQYLKIHQAYTFNNDNEPLIPSSATRAALYFIRNPLDIAGSLANHMAKSMDEAIEMMNDSSSLLANQPGNHNTHRQLRQELLSWSAHAESWTSQDKFPLLVIRYEDMLSDTLAAFTKAVAFLGIDASGEQIKHAIEASSFSRLQQMEKDRGFREKNWQSQQFFRSGTMGNWKKELTPGQIERVINANHDMMKRYGYL